MIITLDLTKRILKDDENKLYFSFEKWSHVAPSKRRYGEFFLDTLQIDSSLLSEVIFEKEEEVISFKADYEDETVSFLDIVGKTSYSREELLKSLDLSIDTYLYKNPLTLKKGEITGEAKCYYNYSDEEFIIEITKLILEEN